MTAAEAVPPGLLKDRAQEQFCKMCYDCVKQLVVHFGTTGIGNWEGRGADAVLQSCCKVESKLRGTDQRPGREVLVDEFRTSRVSSALNGEQPYKGQLYRSKLVRPAGLKPPAKASAPPAAAPSMERAAEAATQTAASGSGPSASPPAKRTKAEQAAEPTQLTKGTSEGKCKDAKPTPRP
ncbi:hypothetical protein QJQ45_005383 [Haematococcus lacustris]|nr:hypothetical protein QJQ45_005383 [Haematococcus lacustris]